ncbi:MAG TPA: hypothetical protein VK658_28300 [Chryseolinea sp.]|nr:hypothetical protein [Chryseolinea sp.]
MAQEIITLEDLQKFRLQLLEDLRVLLQQTQSFPKVMVKKFRSKKDAWHLSWNITKPPYQKFNTLSKDRRFNVL